MPDESSSLLQYVWQELRALPAVASEANYRAKLYRAWQLGHRFMGGPSRRYLRCRCGWEGKAARRGGLSLAALRHLSAVVDQADGTQRPVIDSWPPGIGPESSTEELVDALYRIDQASRFDRDREKLGAILDLEIARPWPGLPVQLAAPDPALDAVTAALLEGRFVVGVSGEERMRAYRQVAARVAAAGLSVHLVTRDDESARRVYEVLEDAVSGEFRVSLVTSDASFEEKRRAFTASVVVGPLTTVAFSYLIDAIDELPVNRMQPARDLLLMEPVDRLLLGDAERLESVLLEPDNKTLDAIAWDSYPLLYRSASGACEPLTGQQTDRLEEIVGFGRVERQEVRQDIPNVTARFRPFKLSQPDDPPPRSMDDPFAHLDLYLRQRFVTQTEELLIDALDAGGRRRIADRWIDQATTTHAPPALKEKTIHVVPSLRRLAPELVDASDVRSHVHERLGAKEIRLGDQVMTQIATRAVQTFARKTWADYREPPENLPATTTYQLATFAADRLRAAHDHVVEDVTGSLLHHEPSPDEIS